jgi:lactate dehydrogenase-like 2-hydroxyacid dehydrogenase
MIIAMDIQLLIACAPGASLASSYSTPAGTRPCRPGLRDFVSGCGMYYGESHPSTTVECRSIKPVVLVTRKLPEAVEERLQRDYEPRLNPDDRLYTKDQVIEMADGADAILSCHTEHLTADVIGRLPDSIRAIANYSVGFDHVNLEAAKACGIIVTNTPEVLSDATAELTILLMLGAARRAGEGERLVRSGEWMDWSPSFMVGTQMTGKRLGIIGLGRVGQVTTRRARGFDMEIHYHDVNRLPPEAEAGAVFHRSVKDLLPHCDFLAIHCVATPET